VTIEQRGANETVVCYALDTGLQRWETGYPAEFRHTPNMGGGGPRTTPAIADGQVYTLGGAGDLSCLDGSTGKLLWRVNVLADNQAKNIEWGCSTSPLITGEQVIIQAGTAGVVAYDRIQGQRIWRGPPRESAYASPMLTEFAGSPHLVIFDAVGLLGLDPKTGQELWSYDWKSAMNMNSAQPVRVGQDGLFVSSEQANGGALLRITKNDNQWAVQQVWRNRSLVARFASPVLVGDCLYGLSAGRLVCLEASTGTQRWKEGNYGNGQILVSGSSLLITTESGELALVAADPEEHRELGRIKVLNSRTWNMPTLIGRSLLMRSHKEMARVELP
jgi:outer membrane protein assembly factor BamB